MNPITVSDLLHLSVPERLQLVEDLWDSIAEEEAELPLSAAKRDELRRRKERFMHLRPHVGASEAAGAGAARLKTSSSRRKPTTT